MNVIGLRHYAIRVSDMENSIAFYAAYGFSILETGTDHINGFPVTWCKLQDDSGFVLELVSGWASHLAFTVKKLNPKKYINLAPSGHLIQFEHDPDGNIIELVVEPKK